MDPFQSLRCLHSSTPKNYLSNCMGMILVQGKVIDLSDSGAQQGTFAVVRVEGLEQPVIVPVERILGIL